MIIYVLDDGERYTLSKPTPIAVTDEQLTLIESGKKVYEVISDWATHPSICNCIKCTTARQQSQLIVKAQNKTQEP